MKHCSLHLPLPLHSDLWSDWLAAAAEKPGSPTATVAVAMDPPLHLSPEVTIIPTATENEIHLHTWLLSRDMPEGRDPPPDPTFCKCSSNAWQKFSSELGPAKEGGYQWQLKQGGGREGDPPVCRILF